MKRHAFVPFTGTAAVLSALGVRILAAVALLGVVLSPQAQPASVSVNAAEFQRLVYSAQLFASMRDRPELDAALTVLLEVQRRNSQADPVALGGFLRAGLERYRTNSPAYVLAGGFRDEILAGYLEALGQVAARTNFVPATLQLLNGLMPSKTDYTNATPAEIINAGSQRLLSSAGSLDKRRALLDACMVRAQASGAFARALDALLVPETRVSVHDPAVAIVGNTNSALYGSQTFQALLALTATNASGSLTISSNYLMTLFATEMTNCWNVVNTNLALRQEFNQAQPDLVTYLNDPLAVQAWQSRAQALQPGQAWTLACANAAVLVQSKLVEADPSLMGDMSDGMKKTCDIISGAADMLSGIASGDLGQGVSGFLNLFGAINGGESAEDHIKREVDNLKTMLGDLSQNMNYRFDRVDQSLVAIFNTLNQGFDRIEVILNAQGQQIFTVVNGVNDIRTSLLDIEADLGRLERELFTSFNALQRNDLILAMNGNLFYETVNPGPMSWVRYNGDISGNGVENTFYTYATDLAQNGDSSPVFTSVDLTADKLGQQVAARPLDANLNYLKQFLSTTLHQSTLGVIPLANLRDWFAGAYAYLELAIENPMHFRTKGPRLPDIIGHGDNLVDFLRSLTFSSGTNLNSSLHNAVVTNYSGCLTNFVAQVHAAELNYGTSHNFSVDLWRNWSAAAPRVTAASTGVRASDPFVPIVGLPDPATQVSAGFHHALAVRTDGTVIGWGYTLSGEATPPAGAGKVVAVWAGFHHSAALKADGTVVCWGLNSAGETNVPTGLNNVMTLAVSAGGDHTLALLTNGTVVAWGDNSSGQTNVPPGLSNIVAIGAGPAHSLAVRADGRVAGWGFNSFGQATAPAALSNVVAVAAGYWHSIALRADGTVFCWGDNSSGQTNVPPEATNIVAIAAGMYHSVALRADGSVFCWGHNYYGQCNAPAGLKNVQAVAAGGYYNLGLTANGTLVAWGANESGQCIIPPLLSWQRTISGKIQCAITLRPEGTVQYWGPWFSPALAIPPDITNVVAVCQGNDGEVVLKADGKVRAWGSNGFGGTNVPPNATNVVALAAGGWHYLALRQDGLVVGWGLSPWGELPVPSTLNSVVAIAAGEGFSLALKSDGSVVGWGNYCPAVPAGLNNVVAIYAYLSQCLALKADGTVVAWGTTTDVPVGLNNVIGISVGLYGSSGRNYAIRADGSIVGWNSDPGPVIPPAATNVVAIANEIAVRGDGSVVSWGENMMWDWGQGQTDLGSGLRPLVSDASTNRFAATHWGASFVPTASPLPGYAVCFDATNDYIATPNLASKLASTNLTLELWFRPEAAGVVLDERDQSGSWLDSQIEVVTSPTNGAYGEVRIRVWPLPSPGLKIGSVPFGTWNHVALRYNRTTTTLDGFLNGTPGPATNVTRQVPSTLLYSLGRADATHLGSGAYFRGQIDEFRVWDVARGQAEIQTNMNRGLSGTEPGLVAYWPFEAVQLGASNVLQLAAGYTHSLALQADGTVRAFGANDQGQLNVPGGLSNVVAVSAGWAHSMALRRDGTVVCWGNDWYGQTDVPTNLNAVVAIAAGGIDSFALLADGTIRAWGDNGFGQSTIPFFGTDKIVAIAASTGHAIWGHALALKANGTVAAWGYNSGGQTNVPPGLCGVVAVAAGENHSLALRTNGQVVAWGTNDCGQLNVPPEAQSGVVAIAAGKCHSLALKQDGTVVTWGGQAVSRFTVPCGLSNVVQIAACGWHSLFLTADSVSATNTGPVRLWTRASIPPAVVVGLRDATAYVRAQMDQAGGLQTSVQRMSGAKALLQSVLELAMPYTLESDGVLHGFLYGSEALTDLEIAQGLFLNESNSLTVIQNVRPMVLEETVYGRFSAFSPRLSQRLLDIRATGQAELPRVLGHTLRLCRLLQDSWGASPPPTLEMFRVGSSPQLRLYGEPFLDYSLFYSENLGPASWQTSTVTNLRSERVITPPLSAGPSRFYKVSPSPDH